MIELQTDIKFLVFTGLTGSRLDGKKLSYQMTLIKEILTEVNDDKLTFVFVDNVTTSYDYKEVLNPSTSVPFTDLAAFEAHIITEMNA